MEPLLAIHVRSEAKASLDLANQAWNATLEAMGRWVNQRNKRHHTATYALTTTKPLTAERRLSSPYHIFSGARSF